METTDNPETLPERPYAENATHANLEKIQIQMSAFGMKNLEKLQIDRHFYEELAGAREAAYEHGIDGAQWMLDHYAINLADFQAVVIKWMTEQNTHYSSADIRHFAAYHQQKKTEYAHRFADGKNGSRPNNIDG
ncbi:DUF6620 family protein [Sphingobacterium paludis]|uniref:Uncharacterized protein n=1 Tax=Sphingobacterium paludis TaxID=1476465 RepID=A0A4R7DC81_9SPHI|nr:DUF6620 family protein [Sphingobacterium paludis]TDS17534.1 hypothetical protein B0I21_101401 [Sphingobacterium paludis]